MKVRETYWKLSVVFTYQFASETSSLFFIYRFEIECCPDDFLVGLSFFNSVTSDSHVKEKSTSQSIDTMAKVNRSPVELRRN